MEHSLSGPSGAPARSASGASAIPVVLGGLATTALALAGVWLAGRSGESVMGWYANYVIPAGAMCVGAAAASGYGLASYLTGTQVTGKLLALVVALLLGSYFLAAWLQFSLEFPEGAFLDDGTPVGFWAYYDLVTRSMHWKASSPGGVDGEPLGLWGYGLRVLEVAGFAGGGAAIPVILRGVPYCAACGSYKKRRRLTVFAAGVQQKKISKKKAEQLAAYEQAHADAYAQGQAQLTSLLSVAAGNDGGALARELRTVPKLGGWAAQKLTARIAITLVRCPRCHEGELRAALETGSGKQQQSTDLALQPLDRFVVGDLLRALDRPSSKAVPPKLA